MFTKYKYSIILQNSRLVSNGCERVEVVLGCHGPGIKVSQKECIFTPDELMHIACCWAASITFIVAVSGTGTTDLSLISSHTSKCCPTIWLICGQTWESFFNIWFFHPCATFLVICSMQSAAIIFENHAQIRVQHDLMVGCSLTSIDSLPLIFTSISAHRSFRTPSFEK